MAAVVAVAGWPEGWVVVAWVDVAAVAVAAEAAAVVVVVAVAVAG